MKKGWYDSIPVYNGPKSVCRCGHLGDGKSSSHAALRVNGVPIPVVHGHGECMVPGCDCKKFTWKAFTESYAAFIKRRLPEKGGHFKKVLPA